MTIGECSILVSIAGVVPYARHVISGEVRPERMTWFAWTAILLLSILGYHASGASDSIWFLVGDSLVCGVVFLLSLWRGVGGFVRLDIACLAVAILGVAIWQLSNQPVFSLVGAILADVMAVIPTLRKSLVDPTTEHASTYGFASVASIMGVLAVGHWSLVLLFYPFYLFLANFTIMIVVFVGQYHARPQPKTIVKQSKRRAFKLPLLSLSVRYEA